MNTYNNGVNLTQEVTEKKRQKGNGLPCPYKFAVSTAHSFHSAPKHSTSFTPLLPLHKYTPSTPHPPASQPPRSYTRSWRCSSRSNERARPQTTTIKMPRSAAAAASTSTKPRRRRRCRAGRSGGWSGVRRGRGDVWSSSVVPRRGVWGGVGCSGGGEGRAADNEEHVK